MPGTDEGNLGPIEWSHLSWEPENTAKSLDCLFECIAAEANKAVKWYLRAVRSKKKYARVLRVGAISFGSIAGIIPIVSQIYPVVSPAWSAVALGIAATLVLLDRYFGFSSGWMRYISAEMSLRDIVQESKLDWECCKAGWHGTEPSRECEQAARAMLRTFSTRVNAVIKQETDAWIQEFQSALSQLDDAYKAKAAAVESGAVNIEVANGEQCQAGWTLAVDNGNCQTCRGKTAALRNIAPGMHTVTVEGDISGNNKQAQTVASVSAGGVTNVQLTLN